MACPICVELIWDIRWHVPYDVELIGDMRWHVPYDVELIGDMRWHVPTVIPGVVNNIIFNGPIFFFRPDDMVVKSSLPFKISEFIFNTPFCDCTFITVDNNRD